MGNMKKTRCKFSLIFKVKVAIEAFRERKILAELAEHYELHPNQISLCKQEFLKKSTNIFDELGKQQKEK